jgi:tetratricopeptide (TPR) repeat protein
LQQHLAFNTLRRPLFLEEAERLYKLAIDHEGGNAEASYNLGDLLYSQFTHDGNEAAIEAYLGALRTDKPVVRARAFRGLANAYCQRCQRHRKDQHASIEAGLRWARFANDFCKDSSPLSREDQASIKKAEAYAQQVWAEQPWLRPEESEKAFIKSVDLYKKAIDLNNNFTVAYNNVSYLYLKKAEKLLSMICQNEKELDEKRKVILSDLGEAEKWCRDAIETDKTFHLAYDNRGNIARALASLEEKASDKFQSGLLFAIEWYHRALSYQPSYMRSFLLS